jgi:hypothetical protein
MQIYKSKKTYSINIGKKIVLNDRQLQSKEVLNSGKFHNKTSTEYRRTQIVCLGIANTF